MTRKSKKQYILESAANIVNRQGTDYLTLDAVAKEASISKGGLLYHVKNREGLIKELVNSGAINLVHGFFNAGPNCLSMCLIPPSPPAR